MKVIITETFNKGFIKEFKKYNFTIVDFINTLKNTNLIGLKEPYSKIKIILDGVSLRGITIYHNNKIIPIFLILKKDKKIGENLVLNKKILEKINNILGKMKNDFEKGDFIEYEY